MIESETTSIKINRLMEKTAKFGILVFLSGFYLIPQGKFHNNLFYLFVLVPGLVLLYKRYQVSLNNKIIFYFGICLLYYALSALWGDVKDFFPAIKYFIYITIFMWVFSYLLYHDPLYRNIILQGLPVIAAISVIINIIFWYSEHPISSRLYGSIGIWECIGLGISYGFACLIALNNTFNATENRYRYFSLSLFFILCAGILLTQSRLAVGAMVGSAILLIISYPSKLIIKIMWLTLLLLLALSFYVLFPQLFERHFELIEQIISGGFNMPRVLIWKSLLADMENTLLFGHGYGIKIRNAIPDLTFIKGSFSTAHSIYIGHLYLGGIFGIILTLIAVGFVGVRSLIAAVLNNNYLGLSLFIFSVLVMSGQYTYLLDHPNEVWINIIIPLSMSYGLSINDTNSQVIK